MTTSISTTRGRVKRGSDAQVQREDRSQFEFRVFHNALLRLPQNSYSARWVSDPGIPWQGIHDLLCQYGYSYVYSLAGIPSTPGGK